MDHAGEILILTGPPGSGKTTTARSLAKEPGSPKVHLHTDDFWHCIKHGAIQPYRPEAHDQNRVVVGVIANAAAGYATGGYFVIVDGIIGPWFLEPFRTAAMPVHYVALRPPLDVAINRCRQRGGDALSDPDVVSNLHRQFSALGPLDRHVVPTAGLTQQDTQHAVITAVEGNRFRLTQEGPGPHGPSPSG